ncbi:MAG: TetR family transcriptional regulator [Actinophytocola sp.]|uniref:TetR/AcrR family transcriptional regulator n=1 Tax=Actinophytocola sp. TaxID=1872138 RepID=UPI0013222FAD|nr:TetR/AcrR family transcriptional regulator [Actinophytocola sp.]MPZ80869.1 TetR family transcriptional regulator [Actinophytocola sp.]
MSTAKSRRDQFSEATRAALLDAATRRFAELGYAGTSLEDVAGDIQATRGAVYHHFSSKRALFEAVFARLETNAVDRAAKAGSHGDNAWHSALLALDEFLTQCCDPVYGRVVWQEGPLALGWTCWIEEEQKYAYGLVEQFVRALLESGQLAPVPLVTTTQLAFGMLGAAGQALSAAATADQPRIKAEYAEVMGRMLTGLRAMPTDRSRDVVD